MRGVYADGRDFNDGPVQLDQVSAKVEGSVEKANQAEANQAEADRAKIRTVLGSDTVQVAELK